MSRRGGRLLVLIATVILVAIVWTLFRRPSAMLATPRLAQFLQPVRGVDTATLVAPLRVAVAVLPSRRAKREHPDLALLVFGEASFGLCHDDLAPQAYQAALAEPIPGPLTQAPGALAHELDLAIAVGLIERTDSALSHALAAVEARTVRPPRSILYLRTAAASPGLAAEAQGVRRRSVDEDLI